MTTALDRRAEALAAASATVADVLVVGGGVNGVGVLLDASTRGLSAVLVERDDLGVGTSSRSSKLIHGGLRYLEHLQFGLVREALAERALLTTLAPHLVRLERFVAPVVGPWWQVPYVFSGLTLYDLLGGRHGGRCRVVPRLELAEIAPDLATAGVRAVFEYTDGVTDDARLLVGIATTAARLGGRMLTQVQAQGLLRDRGRVVGVAGLDRVTGETLDLRARTVIDATGPYSASETWAERRAAITPSRGSHLVVAGDRLHLHRGVTMRVPGRVVFVIPWEGQWLLGTTDVLHDGPVDRPVATADEVDYLLRAVNDALAVDLGLDDVVATFAGVRPLAGDQTDTVTAPRGHRIAQPEPGLVTVRGGKWTTYRRIAAEAVDVAARDLGTVAASATASLPLAGAAPRPALARLVDVLVGEGAAPDVASGLVHRYGTEAAAVAAFCRTAGLDDRLLPGLPYLVGEAAWAARHEWALDVEDVLVRRTRAALQDRQQARAAAPAVAEALGAALGWAAPDRQQAVTRYEERSWEYAPHHMAASWTATRTA